jgi:hypothetical protein
MMDELIKQAPDNLNKDFIEEIYEKNNKDITKTLIDLWNIPQKKEIKKTSWDNIRDTCDAFDCEMNRMISNIRKNNLNNE